MRVIPPEVQGTILISGTEAAGAFWGPAAMNPYAELLKRPPDAIIGGNTLVFRGDVKLPLASAESHISAASGLLQQGHLAEAVNESRVAASLAPNSPDVQAALADVLLKSRSGSEAEGPQNKRGSSRRD